MNPEEKAKELVERFNQKAIIFQDSIFKETKEHTTASWKLFNEHAKQCALICVEELLYFSDTQANGTQKGVNTRIDWVKYFNEVKQEIEKL